MLYNRVEYMGALDLVTESILINLVTEVTVALRICCLKQPTKVLSFNLFLVIMGMIDRFLLGTHLQLFTTS